MGGMEMEWLLLTSANMSQRSWGSLTKAKNKLRVLSFELGVMFLPRLCGVAGLAELAVEEIEDSHQVSYLKETEWPPYSRVGTRCCWCLAERAFLYHGMS